MTVLAQDKKQPRMNADEKWKKGRAGLTRMEALMDYKVPLVLTPQPEGRLYCDLSLVARVGH